MLDEGSPPNTNNLNRENSLVSMLDLPSEPAEIK